MNNLNEQETNSMPDHKPEPDTVLRAQDKPDAVMPTGTAQTADCPTRSDAAENEAVSDDQEFDAEAYWAKVTGNHGTSANSGRSESSLGDRILKRLQLDIVDDDDLDDDDSVFEKEHHEEQEYWASFSDHGNGHEGEPGYGKIPEQYVSDKMTKAAFFCGFGSLVGIFFGMSLPIGALGIVLALLSRDRVLSRQAKTAIGMCIAGISAFLVMIIVSVWMMVSTGVWGYMMDRISVMDPNDPYAITELQGDLIDALQHKLNDSNYVLPEIEAPSDSDFTDQIPTDSAIQAAL